MMARDTDGLTRRQRRALVALLTAPTDAEAAQAVGIGIRTLYAYKALPAFRSAYRRAADRIAEEARDQLQAATVESVAVLRQGLQDPVSAVRIRAADRILHHRTALQVDDLLRRVAELEVIARRRFGGRVRHRPYDLPRERNAPDALQQPGAED